MGLYLAVFDNDEEVDGVEVGSYADFVTLRDCVVSELEGGTPGASFPIFSLHPDCDGEWSIADCSKLRDELRGIAYGLTGRPAVAFTSDWQRTVAKSIGLVPRNAYESFVDVDGEFLIDRIQTLVATALERGLPILFQ